MVELKAYFLKELEPESEPEKKKTRIRSKTDRLRNTDFARGHSMFQANPASFTPAWNTTYTGIPLVSTGTLDESREV